MTHVQGSTGFGSVLRVSRCKSRGCSLTEASAGYAAARAQAAFPGTAAGDQTGRVQLLGLEPASTGAAFLITLLR